MYWYHFLKDDGIKFLYGKCYDEVFDIFLPMIEMEQCI